jgi:serine/threonine-protein kinase RsbW
MGIHLTKDAGGAVVVRVDGQLIVGNRQELKDLINGALDSARHCLSGTAANESLRFRLQVALAEALANAVVCGNQEDPAKSVQVDAELRIDRITVQVTDEGDGFDPEQVPEPVLPEHIADTCGRGLFLIRKLVDDVHFNEQGNSICMTLRRR